MGLPVRTASPFIQNNKKDNEMNLREKGLAGLLCLASGWVCHAEPFIDDSRTSLRYSQFYWKENDGGEVGPNRDEWVQAALFSFNSGWYRDLFGVDYAYGLADALHVGHEATSISNLEAGRSVQSPHGIAKPVEAYLRGRLPVADGYLQLGLGKKSRRYGQYYDDPFSRILPPSTLGTDLEWRAEGRALRYSRLTGFSARNESGWSDTLRNFRGQRIEALHLAAVEWTLPTTSRLTGEYSLAEDYLKVGSLKLEHSLALGDERFIDLAGTLGAQQDAGRLFEHEGVRGLFEAERQHRARYTDLSLKYRTPTYTLGAAYNRVRGGDFDRPFFRQDHGTWNSSAKLFYYFGAEDEAMVKLMAGMDFSAFGLPQLRLDSHYAFSDHAAGYRDFSRREFQSLLQYRFDGPLKGLSLAWLHNRFHTEGVPDGVDRRQASRGPAGIITHHAERLYLNYVYSF